MNREEPTVTVVIPTYNRGEVLGRSIDSVLAQTYEDFELIVVDDGSTDDTRVVCGAFDDDRLTYLHQENAGAAAARNTGIERARGAFVAFQDSDDVWHPEKLREQMAVFERASPAVGVVYTGFWRVTEDDRTYVPGPAIETKEGDVHEALLEGNFVSTQVAVVRKRCFEEVGYFDERLPRFQDWELWLRLSERFTFRLVDEPLVTAYDRPDSISNDPRALVEARRVIVEKHRDTFDADALAEQLFRLGHSSLKIRRTRQGRRYLLRAALTKTRPLYLGCLLLSMLGPDAYNRTYDAYTKGETVTADERATDTETAASTATGVTTTDATGDGPGPAVGIVTVNWENYDDTAACLETLADLDYPNYHVVVVDNGSTDGSGERLEAAFPWCEVVFNERNTGFGGGCNAGIGHALAAGVEYVLLVNNDARVERTFLDEIVAVATESGAGVVGALVDDGTGALVNPGPNRYPDMLFYSGYRENLPVRPGSENGLVGRDGSERNGENGDGHARGPWWETDRVEGAGVLLSRGLLRAREQSVGRYLDDSLFMYCEEIELAMWCREHDVRSVVATDAIVHHDGGASSTRPFQLYYLTRNRVLLAHRYLGGLSRIAFDLLYSISRLVLAARYLKRGDRAGARTIVEGLFDGFRTVEGRVARH